MKTNYLNVNAIGIISVLIAGGARVGHAQGSTDRCSLLTQSAVSAAAGVSVDAGKPIATTGCSWQSEKPHVIVTVSFPGPAMNGLFTKETPTPGVTKTHVGGIGDDALYVTAGALSTLYVKHANDILMLRVYGVPDHDKQKSIEKTLAADVLKKL
jgi:hypothetical protein